MTNPANRTKLDPKSKKLSFINCGGDRNGFRFWDHDNRKIVRSRDVFNEDVLFKDRQVAMQSPPSFPELTVDFDDESEGHNEFWVHVESGAHGKTGADVQQEADLPIVVRKVS